MSTFSFDVKNVACVNEAKAGVPILTGIGYLDHMIDQLNSHAQVGVGLEVSATGTTNTEKEKEETGGNIVAAGTNADEHADQNRFASGNQVELCTAVGNALGLALQKVLISTKDRSPTNSRFCCPLDEALVECLISSKSGTAENDGIGNIMNGNNNDNLVKFSLAPYGIYPRNVGRTKIGKLETFAIESFWRALASSADIIISLEKLRGDNAHHIGRFSILQYYVLCCIQTSSFVLCCVLSIAYCLL